MGVKYSAKQRHKRAAELRRKDILAKSKLNNYKVYYEKI
jgi:hypothetical protein